MYVQPVLQNSETGCTLSDGNAPIQILRSRQRQTYTEIAHDCPHLPMSRAAYIAILGTLALITSAQLAHSATSAADRGVTSRHRASHPRSVARPATTRHPKGAKSGATSKTASGTYAEGYRRGFAEGDAAATRRAAAKRCPAPATSSPLSARVLPERSNSEIAASETTRTTARVQRPAIAPSASQDSEPTTSVTLPGTTPLPRTTRGYELASATTLRGSTASLERQNQRLIDDGMERIEDQRDLEGRITHKLLVPLPASGALVVNQNLPTERRYCRPWTARFLSDLARAHQAAFHEPIEVSSAVRTVAYQKRLMSINGNAAAAEGDVVSPHLTGAAVDLPKSNLSRQELAWMRSHLLALQQAGKIDVEEEFQQSCFHITVYKSYLEGLPPQAIPSSKAGALRASVETAPTSSAFAKRKKARKSNLDSAELRSPRVQPRTRNQKPRAGMSAPAESVPAPTKPGRAPVQPSEVIVEGL